jgi:aspartyl-tRNA(Asn)/glutamyl-tRNA(Gln) amidotransferase subunit A
MELTDFFLARIAQYNPQMNAFITVAAEPARAEARRADDDLARGTVRGPLHGIPLALKDLFDMRGLPTTAGSKILHGHIPADDAYVTARLRDAGAVLLGKLNMHEWAFGVTNDNPHFGRAKNPWDVECVPGGSSGGSAAAVAARFCLGALGSDTGGSIRIPASLCGVTGIKPTYGRVSLRGVVPLSWSLDHAGPLAQTAEDCARILQVIAGYDPLDPVSARVPVPDFSTTLTQPLTGWRIAAPSGYFAAHVDEEILSAVDAALALLTGCGATRVEKNMPFVEELYRTNRLTLPVEAAAYHSEYLATRAQDYGADVRERLRAGAATAAADYVRARRRQVELTRALELYFSDVELLATPTTPVAAPRAGGDAAALAQRLTAFTAPFNLAGFPAISVCCGFTRTGLPMGLQFVARPWQEALLLQAAHQYQCLTDWHARRPPHDGR